MSLHEKSFETEIVKALTSASYYAVRSEDYDTTLGLSVSELAAFVEATQPKAWADLNKLHGSTNAAKHLAQRVAKEIDTRGTLDVLRHGVIDHSIRVALAYFKPPHSFSPDLAERYAQNRLGIVRQFKYEPNSEKAIDLAITVNGLLTCTAELKNPLTKQNVEDAKKQYRERDAQNISLGKRAVVHFAVDTEEVAMTTRLAGGDTQFLPFNKGANGSAGNPANPTGHRSAYLWDVVWAIDNWLELLQRFIHVESSTSNNQKPSTVVFPRYHQWDAVRTLTAAATTDGTGQSYLVQHSAGSGKSNTIAWLAHRLTTLHDANDELIFNKVVVITDRRILDTQLQDTIYQFEHAHGVVEKIEKDSAQLADALTNVEARIIITTLQKFPYVLRQGVQLSGQRIAVIVDEAHSSQTGEGAKDLKLVLGDHATTEDELAAAEAADDGEQPDPVLDALEAATAGRGKQENISFFAFTATPKGRTLEQFGHFNEAQDRYEPFHIYSMKQAIEEGFILDVLQNYVTYKTYWEIEKQTPDDPQYDGAKAQAAIANFVSLHEHNLAQKSQIIIEHFRGKVMHRLGNSAKAMVVTASRLHAARYQAALKKYCNDQGYGLGILVAFSGTVLPGVEDLTEANMNGFPESQTAEAFSGSNWQVLVAANKYQTGFDQPLLYAMYVDKLLSGVAAVQTLSRLNRNYPGKDSTFVLDFRNDEEKIRKAFSPYFVSTASEKTDPNLMYDTWRRIDPFGVLRDAEVNVAVGLLLSTTADHSRIHAALGPAVDRFDELNDARQSEFRDLVSKFVRMYSFLSQVVAFVDLQLERDYVFLKALLSFLRPDSGGRLDIGSAISLKNLRTEEQFSGAIALADDIGEVQTTFSASTSANGGQDERLSTIIDRLNLRFGTNWAPEDRVFYDVIADKLAAQPEIQRAAAVNTPDNFRHVLSQAFMGALIDQMGVAESMSLRLIDDEEMQAEVLAAYLPFIQGRAKVARQEHCPLGELLKGGGENQHLEYKSTLRTHAEDGSLFKPLESAVLKTVAAFQNSRDGGTLLIGVRDNGEVHGLSSDYSTLHAEGKDDRDVFQLHLGNIIVASMGEAASTNVAVQIHTVDDNDVCRVHVRPSSFPVDARVVVVKKNQQEKKISFFVRSNNGTRELSSEEKVKYVLGRWPQSPANGPKPQ